MFWMGCSNFCVVSEMPSVLDDDDDRGGGVVVEDEESDCCRRSLLNPANSCSMMCSSNGCLVSWFVSGRIV